MNPQVVLGTYDFAMSPLRQASAGKEDSCEQWAFHDTVGNGGEVWHLFIEQWGNI